MTDNELMIYGIPAGLLLLVIVVLVVWYSNKIARIRKRIDKIRQRRMPVSQKALDVMTLRRKQKGGIPIIGPLLRSIPTTTVIAGRIQRAGLTFPAENYIMASVGSAIILALAIIAIGLPTGLGVLVGLLCLIVPHMALGFLGNKRLKKFIGQFPDAIDLMVRGLRSGLPVTESMNMVSSELEDPICSIFADIKESVRLGVSLEKSLQETAKKLGSTEFNFFVTSIILQRETGGNLSEILNNLSDVLRKRFMMKMKIKALSSEAKASAIIVGALPFFVILALTFVSPGYLDPLMDDFRGNIAAAGAALSLLTGIGIMFKMSRFEI